MTNSPAPVKRKRKNISGHLVTLDENRLVFLGQNQNEPDVFYVGFRNRDGNDLKLMLSREALLALIRLATEPEPDEPKCDFPHKTTWVRMIKDGADAA